MKSAKYITSLVMVVNLLLMGCKKDDILPGEEVASLTITNAVAGSSALVANINQQLPYYKGQVSVPYGGFRLYQFVGGPTSLDVRQVSDTAHSLYLSGGLSLAGNTVHSLFITGNATTPDSLLATDNLLYHRSTDSTMGIRFVNLLSGSTPVSVNIKGQAAGTQVGSLGYKNISDFQAYSAHYQDSSYVFEFRDKVTDTLIKNFTVNNVYYASGTNTITNSYRFRNFTIMLYGVVGGTGATAPATAIITNNY